MKKATEPQTRRVGKKSVEHEPSQTMTTENNQDQPNPAQSDTCREQCADCDVTLVEDQRYCLQCGARRGKPRVDFAAFWGALSPTGGFGERSGAGDANVTTEQARARSTGAPMEQPGTRIGDTAAGQRHSWWAAASFLGAGAPSRGMAAALATGVLAVGILAGVALGPGPASSPADSATLAQRALAALVARAGSGSQDTTSTDDTPAPTPPPPPIASEPTPTPATPDSTGAKTEPAPSSSEASGSSESSGESTTSGSSEGSFKSSKGSGESKKTAPGTPIKLPAIKHIWVIALSGTSFSAALANPTIDPYLAKQLVPKGTLLSNYALSSSSALGNGVALLAGQGVNLDTEQNCPTYSELQPPTVNAATGLAEGVGCVYPATVKTLADELTAGSLTWKAYVQGMEASAPASSSGGAPPTGTQSDTATGSLSSTSTTPSSDPPSDTGSTPNTAGKTLGTGAQPQPTTGVTCRRPELGAADPNHTPIPGDPYLTYRNPFVYFDSLLSEGACASNDVDLSQLQASLATPADTPSLSWIVPSACNDGSATPCAPGSPAGLAPAEAFLKEVVPQILTTSAYAREGLIVIVPDSPPASPASAASKPVGALLLSPFVHSDKQLTENFNDFSLLKSISLLFGVLPLGHANDQATVSFGATVYGASGKAASAASTAKKAAQAASTQTRHLQVSDPLDQGSSASLPGG
jgi:phosphatidylinositol-3-phosphatase